MIHNPSITFETKCWEKDWKYLLKTNVIKNNINRNEYPFEKKVLMINNVSSYKAVTRAADKLIDNGILTDYFLVDDWDHLDSYHDHHWRHHHYRHHHHRYPYNFLHFQ